MNIDGNKDLHQFSDKLHDCLRDGDSIFFLIKKKQARVFKRQAKRIIQSENYLKNRRGILSRIKSSLYLIYVSLINYWFSEFKYKELNYPLLVYTTCWRYIKTIGGEDVPNEMAKITFYGRKL